MRADEILYESRGVTARAPGETYVNVADPSDVLTIGEIVTLPSEGAGYETLEELEEAIGQAIPDNGLRVNDNNSNAGMRAAVLASVTDADGNAQYWVRYLKQIPAAGVTGLWKTFRGYKYGKGAKEESMPIKPSDLVTDENYRSTEQLANDVMSGINNQLSGSEHEALIATMDSAVKQARSGQSQYIDGAQEYTGVLQKYGGEYLGPLALIDATASVTGNTTEMLKHFNLSSLKGSKVMFPQDTAMELIDSIIETPDGQKIQISSKISKSGGAASSLSGVAKQLTDEHRSKYPNGTKIIDLLATESAVNGPLKVARMFNLIDQNDVQALSNLEKSSQNIQDLQSERLRNMTAQQGVRDGTLERPDYRVFFHTLTAIMNQVISVVNADEEFKAAMMAALNNNQYVQLLTKGSKQGDNLALSYYTKFPAVFDGAPQLVNKVYFATGQKGRIGFKLK
ncbi:hypothetical protein N9578_00665 [bacterium]|nr:hypothetical protein [bacterium]MDB4128541.1 hypothetical protein [bacterium]